MSHHQLYRLRTPVVLLGMAAALSAPASGMGAVPLPPALAAVPTSVYVATPLVSDEPGEALTTDPNLVNAWGIVHSATSPWWVADAETGKSTLYNAAGAPQSLVVSVPGEPTGIVANAGNNFVVTSGMFSGPARFLFASEDGTLSGWNSGVPPPAPSTLAFVVANRSGVGAIYKGLAIDSPTAGTMLYATDFHNARVDVFDSTFTLVNTPGAFSDPGIPAGYAPFGIQVIGTTVYVSYARQGPGGEDDEPGPHRGYLDAYSLTGTLLGRVVTRGPLDSPWGITLAPATGFGPLSGALLVGNFGDGRINAFDPVTHAHLGTLRDTSGAAIEIEGLWGIGFGNGASAGPATTLYFAAGPDDEEHGLFGKVEALP